MVSKAMFSFVCEERYEVSLGDGSGVDPQWGPDIDVTGRLSLFASTASSDSPFTHPTRYKFSCACGRAEKIAFVMRSGKLIGEWRKLQEAIHVHSSKSHVSIWRPPN